MLCSLLFLGLCGHGILQLLLSEHKHTNHILLTCQIRFWILGNRVSGLASRVGPPGEVHDISSYCVFLKCTCRVR